MTLTVHTFALGPLETNSYIVEDGTHALAVDAGGDPAPMLELLKDKALTLDLVLSTHLHFDHVYGNHALAQATGAEILAGKDDAYLLESELGRGGFMGLPLVDEFEFTPIAAGERTLLGRSCQVLATPGHTPGSLSYHFADDGIIFVGDVLFYRGVGRSDFPGGNQQDLLHTIREKLFALPPQTVVYSGHGPSTSIGDEQKNNPYAGKFA